MAIQITMKAMYRRGKLDRLREYLNDPFKDNFISDVREKLIQNIRTAGSRPLPYHTYPSRHEGNLETTCYVKKAGVGKIVLGSAEPYAGILEFGRRAMYRRKPFIFRGYYPSIRAIGMARKAGIEIARFNLKGGIKRKKSYKNKLPYGMYTVFSTKLKGIKPYHVFTKTAEWAEDKFVKEVKTAVRKIDMNMAT